MPRGEYTKGGEAQGRCKLRAKERARHLMLDGVLVFVRKEGSVMALACGVSRLSNVAHVWFRLLCFLFLSPSNPYLFRRLLVDRAGEW